MKKILFLILIIFLSLFFLSHNQPQSASALENETNDGIIIHVSNGLNEPHRVLMALSLAEKMTEDKDVILYFDVKGIEVVLKDSPPLSFASFTNSDEQLQKLLDHGIVIMACPGCLKALGKTPEDLKKGVILADKDKFFNFTSGRIITMNY